jgi:RNA polymerase sigma factor (sigma-70 family)
MQGQHVRHPRRATPGELLANIEVGSDEGRSSVEGVYREMAVLLRRLAVQRFRIPLEDVDALVHDVFATYIIQRTSVHSIRGYLIGGICNASRQYWRERRNMDALFTSFDEERAGAPEFVDRVVLQVALGATLSRLGVRCRETLRRYYLEEQSTADIAKEMETSTGNVLKILHDCRKTAREVYLAITRVTT